MKTTFKYLVPYRAMAESTPPIYYLSNQEDILIEAQEGAEPALIDELLWLIPLPSWGMRD